MKRVFILDRSGSMHTTLDDTIGGYNSFIDEQKELGGTLTLVTFSDDVTTEYVDIPIDEVKHLSKDTYVPMGNTALYDAIGKVLTEYKPDTVIIMTDGVENASRMYTPQSIKYMIEKNTENGVLFMYLGANQDAFFESENLGIQRVNAMSYDTSQTPEAFNAISQCIRLRSIGDRTTPMHIN